ncbi:MAG: hypothetical protein IT323_08310 [Anaerolineae bacterium]|nr:hypothetical protein [Anaerolineae bacterium]
MNPDTFQQVATVTGAVLTLMVFSYLLGDNFLYRIAIHVLIGAAAAYILLTAVENVLIPWVNVMILGQPVQLTRAGVGLLPFMVGILLFFKSSTRFIRLGNLGLMIVLGIGTGLALWGAISGTLFPLSLETIRDFTPQNVINGLIALVGTLTVLVYFTYIGVRRSSGEIEQILPVRAAGLVGRGFLMVTLGATYGLLIISAVTVLTGVIAQRLLPLLP